MIRRIVRKPVPLVFIALLLMAIAAFMFFQFSDTAKGGTAEWPALTMVYEVDGRTVNGTAIREVHSFGYVSTSDWTDTVIESEQIDIPGLGSVYTTGSYKRVNGSRYEEYDAIDDELVVDEVGEDSIEVPNAFLVPDLIEAFKEPGEAEIGKEDSSPVSTTARVCYRQECGENVMALSLNRGSDLDSGGVEWVIANDLRYGGFPLKVGDIFEVRSLDIDALSPTAE